MDPRSRLQISWLGGSPIAGIEKEKENSKGGILFRIHHGS
jgi:hypothetical protein